MDSKHLNIEPLRVGQWPHLVYLVPLVIPPHLCPL